MKSNKLLKQFFNLSFQNKRKKTIILLDWLKHSNDIFRQMMVYIKVADVDEKFIDDIYRDIIEFWTFMIDQKNNQKNTEVQQKIKKIQEEEYKEEGHKEVDFPNFTF